MRNVICLCGALFISGLAFGQATVVAGYASDWRVAPGTYAVPFVPLVNTPSISLESPAFPKQPFAQPVWYGGGPEASSETGTTAPPADSQRLFHFGAAAFQSSYGVARLAQESRSRPSQKAVKLYTNADVEKFAQESGAIAHGNKTEHLQ
jgi:hypothetical protein